MIWNSTAPDRQSKRERFSRPLVVIGITAAFLGLLALFYPKRELLQILQQDGRRTPATRVYLQTMLRNRPSDHQMRLRLGALLLESGDAQTALQVLDGVVGPVSAVEQVRYHELEFQALQKLVRTTQDVQISQRFLAAANDILLRSSSVALVQKVLEDARRLRDDALAVRAQAVLMRLGSGKAAGEDYRQRADTAFAAMQRSTTIADRRMFFLQGLGVLQEGNLYRDVMVAADRHIGPLADDRETMIALTRLALAVGYPDRAQRYIRKALGMGGR